ncbi:ribosomal RNA small subunit methyltransferase A [Candidatus Saccharibacteria bacterium]|nr:ribosomal RNA small subunit methyltransferase A [Candidatus Saccharibacteria bacterium]
MKNKKALGQHWLKNREILEEIADEARFGVFIDADTEESAYDSSEKTGVDDEKLPACVEIGPGLGFLTSSLLKRFEKVVAVEYDKELAEKLPKSFPGKNLEVVNEDILKFDFEQVFSQPNEYVIAGNIPYYITSPIIEKILTLKVLPRRVVLLVQKEVAERILDEKETMLSLFVKNRAKVFRGAEVPAREFTPPPKVDSEVVVFEPFLKPLVSDEVFKLIKVGFLAPRKKLVHNLAGLKSKEELEEIFKEIELSTDVRAGDLSLEAWAKLYKKIY